MPIRTRYYSTVARIFTKLFAAGHTLDQVMEFAEDCTAEAQIRATLPPCKCKDVNQCGTWCRAKARFIMDPQQD